MTKKNNKKTMPARGVKSSLAGDTKKPTRGGATIQDKTEKGKSPLTVGTGASFCLALLATLLLVALGVYHLVMRNSDVLFMAQSKDFFTTNRVFLDDCMKQPGGFISWASAFLTQFFYHPKLGATIMMTMWVAAMWISKVAFKVRLAWMPVLALPLVCLLVGVIDTGYWLYYVKQTGYWFYGTIGYLCAMILVAVFSLVRKRADKIIVTLLIAVTYPFLGWYTLLALLYTIAITLALPRLVRPVRKEDDMPDEEAEEQVRKSATARILHIVLAGALVAGVPLLAYTLYPEMRFEDLWTSGFPYFTSDELTSMTPEIPFIVMAILPLGFAFLPKQKELKGVSAWGVYVVTLAVVAFSIIWTEQRDFQNYNYHAEMRMYRAADEQDWDKLLDEMSNIPGDASRQMVLLKNVALLNKGEMGSKMFHYNNMGEPPTNGFDTLHVHMVQTAAPLLYYYHGKTNFASRWCIENSVEFGFDYDNLKVLARCALVNGEMDVARKYLEILRTTIYYKDWAEDLLPITEKPELIKEHHEFDSVRELRDHMGTVLDGDNGLCEMYLLNYFSNTMNKDSKLLQELTLNYALIQKDIQLFWPRFFLYAQLHKGEEMPVHYQEAAYLYGNLERQTVDISNMPFDKNLIQRYNSFQQLSQSLLSSGMKAPEVGQAMKASYGDTFYWFYFFCRDIHSY